MQSSDNSEIRKEIAIIQEVKRSLMILKHYLVIAYQTVNSDFQ